MNDELETDGPANFLWKRWAKFALWALLWCIGGLFFGILTLVTLSQSMPPALQAKPAPEPTRGPALEIKVEFGNARHEKGWWARPIPIDLAADEKHTEEEREAILLDRLDDAAKGDGPSETTVDQSMGVTVVRSGTLVLVTVLPQDLPEYAVRLDAKARTELEARLAQGWSKALTAEILTLRWRAGGTYAGYAFEMVGWLLLMGICLHRLLSLLGRVLFDSPLWGAKSLLWAVIASWSLFLLPGTYFLGYFLAKRLAGPLFTLLTLSFVATLLHYAGCAAMRRYVNTLVKTRRYRNHSRARRRLDTLRTGGEFLLRVVLSLLVGLLLLMDLQIKISSLITGAGLLGATITFVCQDIIRDFLAGFNILLEDQFGIGDSIEGAGVSGQVEVFTLRSTQIRLSDGSLMTVPNSELRRVKNQSKEWSQVDFTVVISNQQALLPALECLREELLALKEDLPHALLGDPELLGAEDIRREGCSLRAFIKTMPGQQWLVKRQLTRRVKLRFEEEGIQLPRSMWDAEEKA